MELFKTKQLHWDKEVSDVRGLDIGDIKAKYIFKNTKGGR